MKFWKFSTRTLKNLLQSFYTLKFPSSNWVLKRTRMENYQNPTTILDDLWMTWNGVENTLLTACCVSSKQFYKNFNESSTRGIIVNVKINFNVFKWEHARNMLS